MEDRGQPAKDEILQLYVNQIFLGQRAYGFAAASQIYFGKPLKDITVAEAAMLAGLPKAPSAYNPVTNPKRAKSAPAVRTAAHARAAATSTTSIPAKHRTRHCVRRACAKPRRCTPSTWPRWRGR